MVRCEAYAYHQKYLPQEEKDYDPETVRRIRSGADVTAPQYIQAQRELLQQRRQILQMFERVDLILTPTTPMLAPTFEELQAEPDQFRNKEMIMLRNTRPFNVYGLPCISLNCGLSKSGLPIGLQIIGAPGAEGSVLALAHAYQKQTDWHRQKPRHRITFKASSTANFRRLNRDSTFTISSLTACKRAVILDLRGGAAW